MKKRLFVIILILSFLKIALVYPEKEISKKYHNNLLAGGIPRIYSAVPSNTEGIDISYIYINISLFKDYSLVDINCKVKNNGNDRKIYFAYPRLDANISKIIITPDKKEKKQIINEASYDNYRIRVNGASINYKIESDDLIELMYPFKFGDLIKIGDDLLKPGYEEIVDSFNFYYSWYISEIDIKNDESKSIRVTYKTPHYYNTISLKNSDKKENFEDPALKYYSFFENNLSCYESEKVFFFPLSSSYIDKNKEIDKIIIKINANVIDQEYLKVNPINFKNRRNIYYWKYNNLKPQTVNNVFIKISPIYSKDSYNALLFSSSKSRENKNNSYELSDCNDDVVFKYNGNESISIRNVRVLPEYFKYKSELKDKNIPLEFEVSFSDYENFSNSKKFIKKYSKKKFIRNMNRKSYLEIYDGKEISCKYIKIRVLKSSKTNGQIIINDVQFLR